jgi:membrane peptidoglycan carboxypeptidase
MESGPEFFTRDTTEDVTIRTTLDPRVQRAAEDALAQVFGNQVREGSTAEAAIVVMGADGAVRAMVGGRQSGAGLSTAPPRRCGRPGSSFKPFVYAAALDLGMSPTDVIDDSPHVYVHRGLRQLVPGQLRPHLQGADHPDPGPGREPQHSRRAASEFVGRESVRSIAAQFGIEGTSRSGRRWRWAPRIDADRDDGGLCRHPERGLGGAALRADRPHAPGDEESLMGQAGGIRERVIREEAARELTWMMWRVVEEGTGQRARIPGWEIAGKTGTTQGARDAWFIGFSADYVTGVWMGYDDNTPLTGVTGGGLPADIWRETMTRVLSGEAPRPLPMLPPMGGDGRFVNPGGLLADGTGEAYSSTGDPEVDAALAAAFGAPSARGSGDARAGRGARRADLDPVGRVGQPASSTSADGQRS